MKTKSSLEAASRGRHAPRRTYEAPVAQLDQSLSPSRLVARRRIIIKAVKASLDVACLGIALGAVGSVLHPHLSRLTLAAAAPIWVMAFRGAGLYSTIQRFQVEEFRRIAAACAVGLFATVAATSWGRPIQPSWLASMWLAAVTLEIVVRGIARRAETHLKSKGFFGFRSLIVGTTTNAVELAHSMQLPESEFALMGYVAHSEALVTFDGLPVVGTLDDLEDVIRANAIECVFVPGGELSSDEMTGAIRTVRRAGAALKVKTNFPESFADRLSVEALGETMTLTYSPVRLHGPQAFLKRMLDVSISATLVALLMPIMLAIALLVKATSKGPVLFRQARVTQGGRSFRMHKFRTMAVDGERILRERGIDPTQPFFKMRDDPRLTSVGRLLRRTSLDELPQLFDVLRGEMSMVGPRPLPADQVAANIEDLGPRHDVRAGLTGWWQINGRSDVAPAEALRLDRFYIENWSLLLDVYVLLRTFGAVLKKGAY